MASGLLYGRRFPRKMSQSMRTDQALTDLVSWAENNHSYTQRWPAIPSAGQPPYYGRIVLESDRIYRPPAGNECSGVVALGEDENRKLILWGLVYWGPARGGHAQRRCLYRGRSLYLACKAVNDELSYRVHNDLWYSEGPLRPLSPDKLLLP